MRRHVRHFERRQARRDLRQHRQFSRRGLVVCAFCGCTVKTESAVTSDGIAVCQGCLARSDTVQGEACA